MKFVKHLETGEILELPDAMADMILRNSVDFIELNRWIALAQLTLKKKDRRRKYEED